MNKNQSQSSNWNKFQKSYAGKGYSQSELSIMYKSNQYGGGKLTDLKNKSIVIAKTLSKHSSELIELGKSATKMYNDLYTKDKDGKKILKSISSNDLDKHLESIKTLANNIKKTSDNINKTHSELSSMN
jgi:membrane-bound lytic murein transglycosylase MltF